MIKQILVPTDFSKTSKSAFNYALEIASKFGSAVTVYHAWKAPLADPDLSVEEQESIFVNDKKEHVTRLQAWCSEAGIKSVICSYIIEEDTPVDGIVKQLSETGYELVVMGTRGITEDSKIWLGSNTSKVISESGIPVLAIPLDLEYRPFREMLVAVEEEDTDLELWQYLVDWVKSFSSKLTVIHVAETDASNEQQDHWTKRFEEKLRSKFPGLNADIEVIYNDNIPDGINNTVESHQADLLVMFTRRRTFIGRLLAGSVTRKMAAIVNSPLLALPFQS